MQGRTSIKRNIKMVDKSDVAALSKELEDYEIFDDDATQARMAMAEPNRIVPWVSPEDLKLKHRIGRGPFGDVWLATLHSSNEDFDEYHEVAVKILPLINDEQMQGVLSKLEHFFLKGQGLKQVSWPIGICRKNDKLCIIMKFYEGSIGDKMAHLKANKLPLTDVIRYGLDLAHGVMELHSIGVLALNLKPCNFLLDDQDKATLGEFGIPMLLLGSSSSNSEAAVWLGTPHFMAPEQWRPDMRGPVSFETDSWGFGCSIIEMVTGQKPWNHCTSEEIFTLVVVKQQKPRIPDGLPSAIKNVLRGCFEYDYRNRPAFTEIIRAFENPQFIFKEGDWVYMKEDPDRKVAIVKTVVGPDSIVLQYGNKQNELLNNDRMNKLSFWKNSLGVGYLVRLKDPVEPMRTDGTIISIDTKDGTVLVRFSESQDPVSLSPSTIERVSSGFVVGDFVRLGESRPSDISTSLKKPSSVGIIHGIEANSKLKVAFLGRETLCTCNSQDLEKVKPLCVGQFVKIRSEVGSPRFQWPLRKDHRWDTGRIVRIAPNGGLVVRFPRHIWNWDEWWADPEEIQIVQMSDYVTLFDKYHHLESMHWLVRPLVFTLALLAAVKIGTGIVRALPLPGRGKKKEGAESEKTQGELVLDGQSQAKDPMNLGTPWLPPSVANVLFRDGTPA